MTGQPDRVVYVWPKNAREEVRASLMTYRGLRLADLRVYAADEPKLKEAVDALIAAAGEEQAA